MAFSFPTEVAFVNRYNTLHEELRDAVDSQQGRKVLESISKEHYLNEEKQRELGALVAFVLMGFLAKSELTHEISERLFLNHEHSRALASELNTRIFDSVKEELDDAYNPYGDETEASKEEQPTSEEQPVEETGVSTIKVEPVGPIGEKIQVSALGTENEAPVSLPISEDGGPVMLQKSGSFFEKPVERTEKRRSPIPFNMFSSSPESTEAKPAIKVKIETPHAFSWPFEKKKDEEKIVHYSETRGQSSPLPQTPEGLIHLEALQNSMAPASKVPEKTNPTVQPTVASSIGALQPKTPEIAPITPAKKEEVAAVVDTSALTKSVQEEEKKWSIKSMFGKKKEEKKIPVENSGAGVPAIDANQHIPVPITTSSAPVVLSDTPVKEAGGAQKEAGPALEGNVVHLK